MKSRLSRRKFIKSTLVAGVAVAGSPAVFAAANGPGDQGKSREKYNAKGLPTVVLGSTGVVVPRMAIGLGSRFLTISGTSEALEMCNYALDNGLYYWDTANSYINSATGAISEERLGHIVKDRRNEIFLSTKIAARNTEEAKKQVEESLKRLQTDHLDMLKIHSVESPGDVQEIIKAGGVLDLISRMKEQGVTRFIGFSGHADAEALRMLVETGRFDSMLFAMNHYTKNIDRQAAVIPAAQKRGMGIMLMKAVRPKETIPGLDAQQLVRFALSLEGPSGVVVGMESRKVVDSNLGLLRNFKPMDQAEKQKFAMMLSPYFRHENLAWMDPGYHDGIRT
jgi:uncharacterized protein